jgi:transposase InsO family protein
VSQSKKNVAKRGVQCIAPINSRKRAATGSHDFDRLCADLGIEHRLTPPMRPQTNGMVERFNGRIEDVLQSHHFNSREDLEQTLMRYPDARQLSNARKSSAAPVARPENRIAQNAKQRLAAFRRLFRL